MTKLHPEDLEPGDVLLSRGTSDFSALIADIDRSGYSHSAYWDGSSVIEATIRSGVARRALAESLSDVAHLDVYRFVKHVDGKERWLGSRGWAAAPVHRAARDYLARPYAYDQILTLAATLAFGPEPSPEQMDVLMQRVRAAVPPAVPLDKLVAEVPRNAVICTGVVAGTFWNAGEKHKYALEVAQPRAERSPGRRSAREGDYAALRSRVQSALGERFRALRPHVAPEARRGTRSLAATARAGSRAAPLESITLAKLAQSPTLRAVGRLAL